MARTAVVTGSASGIGKATKEHLESLGQKVIGVDLHNADINVDLGTAEGRLALVEQVRAASGGRIDAVYAVAGIGAAIPATVSVNYFGAIATMDGLRPLLAGSDAPRVVAVDSMASLKSLDDELVSLMLDGDEAGALKRADREEFLSDQAPANKIYASTKKALALWIRRNAAKAEWAGAGIPLNAVAPGIVSTETLLKMAEMPGVRDMLLAELPMPLNGFTEPITIARALAWLGSPENTHMCGQIVFVDGGSDVVLRGDSTW